MKFYSINHKSLDVSFKQALLDGVAQDGGLLMPRIIPKLPPDFFKKISKMTFQEIAFTISNLFLKEDIPSKELRRIIKEAFDYPVPLVKLNENLYLLELFHGPTLAFKDFGCRFMARLLPYYAKQLKKKTLTVLVATSGDTGAAVASGFFNIPGIKVVILYPAGKVTKDQEAMLTKWGNNIIAFEIKGNFDDCQNLTKKAFADNQLKKKLFLTSANSINIARLLPQIFYYFWAFAKLNKSKDPLIISVPSGNFGNFTAGIIAKKMGLPVKKFIAATNANDVFTKFIQSGVFTPKPSIPTISNAMDVGNPNNFARILDLYKNNYKTLCKDIDSYSFSDRETEGAIKYVHAKYGYILDPHSVIGYLGLQKYQKNNPDNFCGIFLATAHPAKFKEVMENILKIKMKIPKELRLLARKKKISILLANKYSDFRKCLMNTLDIL